MIKRLIWTIILLSPAVVAGFIAILSGDGESTSSLFNAGAAVNWTWDAIVEFIHLFSEEKRNVLRFIWVAIVAAFFVAPLLFVWRGLFFIEWIPVVGFGLRSVAMAFLILLPGIYQVIVTNVGATNVEWASEITTYMQAIVLGLALIGLWLPKSITTNN